MPMLRWQNFIAIVAIFFAAGAVWPWSPLNRVVCAGIAFALILVLLVSRLQQHATRITGSRSSIEEMQSRIDKIRAERERRYGRR
ncbi:MAG: hypothetical protein JO359_12985 [Candidatus Eremiobacteraeota bacterium]|nr:hypothetical protein [Candidatus Eremiobacteraeota bacterium]